MFTAFDYHTPNVIDNCIFKQNFNVLGGFITDLDIPSTNAKKNHIYQNTKTPSWLC